MMNEWLKQNKIPIIFATLGLMVAVLFLIIGFLKTMLLLIFTALGGYLGFYLKEIGYFDQFQKPRR